MVDQIFILKQISQKFDKEIHILCKLDKYLQKIQLSSKINKANRDMHYGNIHLSKSRRSGNRPNIS